MRALVVIPTYNEAESVVEVLDRVLAADPRVDVLVVDDGSPDGTAKLVLGRAEGEPRVHLLERPGQAGAGRRLPGRVRLGAGARLRRPGRDGRRPVPPPGPAAGAARRAGRGRPGDRVALRARRADGQLEPAAGGHLARRQRLCPPRPAAAGPRLHRRLPRLPAGGAGGPAGGGGPLQRLLLPGRDGPPDLAGGVPGGRGADHLHRAGLGGVQDEQADRGRGAAAGHPVGAHRGPAPGPPAPSRSVAREAG